MNKQEAIKYFKAKKDKYIVPPSDIQVSIVEVIDVISQIHEPQKVVVPKCIADKIEYCKNAEGYGLFHAMDYCYQYKDSADWLEDHQETFARAWLDGYEIEQEQLYTVEIPDPNNNGFIILERGIKGIVLSQFDEYTDWKKESEFQLTESEIKKDFEWAWDAGFAKEVE